MGILLALAAASHASAQATLYWDTGNGNNLTSGSAVWDAGTTAAWATSSTPGTTAPGVWTNGDIASFVDYGTDTVTISGTVIAASVTENGTTNVTINSGTLQTGGVTLNAGSMTINSAVNMVSSANRSSLTNNNSGALAINGSIGETTAGTTLRAFVSSTGSFALGGSNTFMGGVQIYNNSSLTVTNVGAFGTGTGNGNAVLFGQAGANYNETLNVNLASAGTISQNLILTGNASGSGSPNQSSFNSNGAGAVTFNGNMLFNSQVGSSGLFGSTGAEQVNLGGTSIAANTFSTKIIDSGTGTNITSLTKQGTGKWILANANTYTGATTVNSGTLLVNGSAAAGSAVTVQATAANDTALLGGSGTVAGTIAVGGGVSGTISAIAVADIGTLGTLSTGAITAAANSAFDFDIDSGSVLSDFLAVNGSLSLGSNLAVINVTDLGGTVLAAGTIFNLASFSSVTGTFSGLADGADLTIGVNTFQVNYGTLNTDELTLEVVPEPGPWTLIVAGLLVLFALRRKDDRKAFGC